ncbi:MAG: ABC transporter ATP-binding protein [Oligoflexia bacterium]|nr:ABC transporter ATP-binding protein [Oligoflexia bacterium]
MLNVSKLSFGYNQKFRYTKNQKLILNDISFEVNRGEIVALLGINGSGKSTLLKCIANLLVPQYGEVKIFNKPLKYFDRNTLAKHICYTSQYSQHQSDFGFSVFESILLGRKPYYSFSPSKSDLQITEEIVKQMSLNHLVSRDIGELSGGEFQKIILARSFAKRPDLLLLDEPTNHLDIKNQFEIMDLIYQMVRIQNITAIISIHDINMALRYSDRLMILQDGKVIFFDRLSNLKEEILKDVYQVDLQLKEFNNRLYLLPTKELPEVRN